MKGRRPERSAHFYRAVLLAYGCCACSVGAPLVDHQRLRDGGVGPVDCPMPPPCDEAWVATRIPEQPPFPTLPAPIDCAAAESSTLKAALTDGAAVGCLQISLTADDFGDERALHVHDVSWHDVDLTVTTDVQLELTLEAASLEQVFLHLVGPVRVRIMTPVDFRDVRLLGEAENDGEPSLELAEVAAGELTAGLQEQPFAGVLSLTRSVLAQSQLIADRLVLESVVLTNASIAARDLRASDADLMVTRLSVDQALISASTLAQIVIDRCGSLTIISSRLTDAFLPACENPPARIYSATLRGVVLDGEIEGDRGIWSATLLGFRTPTKLTGWATGFSAVTFCDQVDVAMFSGANLSCSGCVKRADDPFCTASDFPGSSHSNFCAALDDLPTCADALPERTRPMRP